MTAEGLPYGPGSMVWLVNKEVAVLLAGGRALLLQLANPGVAAGVDEHSDFRQHPLRRLWR
ncbi:MAG: oxygenase MpaB family protein, partial [Candidatus Dormibacteraceae bacterium]